MAGSFKTKYISIYYCLMIFVTPGFTAEPNIYPTDFHKAANPNYVIIINATFEKATSKIQCAVKCLNHKCSCYSFNKLQQRCIVGTCKSTNISTGTNDEIYVACNTTAGFKLVTSGSVTACVWASTATANYFAAKDVCKAKGAYLYTMKTMDKKRLVTENFSGTFWIGLNDIDVEGELSWEDDYTICDSTCISQIFQGAEPNDYYSAEDCVAYSNNYLNDWPCGHNFGYICEQPFFNWP